MRRLTQRADEVTAVHVKKFDQHGGLATRSKMNCECMATQVRKILLHSNQCALPVRCRNKVCSGVFTILCDMTGAQKGRMACDPTEADLLSFIRGISKRSDWFLKKEKFTIGPVRCQERGIEVGFKGGGGFYSSQSDWG